MDAFYWAFPTLVGVGAGLATFAVLAALALVMLRRAPAGTLPPPDALQPLTTFLFDNDRLVDATPGAHQLLSLAPPGGSAWSRLMQLLHARFPGIEERMAELLDRGMLQLDSVDGRTQLLAEWREGMARLRLTEISLQEGDVPVDRLALRTMEQELALLRSIATRVPYLTWVEAPDGSVTWANAAYMELADSLAGHAAQPGPALPPWPPARVFPEASAKANVRLSVLPPGGSERWYDLHEIRLDDGRLRVATPADYAVAAERSRIEFLQTLTKTFATLSVGLAVFDRARRLVLFNPALVDLTTIPAELLVQRPSFNAFAERLREARVLPEPRDFSGWKQSMTRTVSEAERGTLAETWNLPNGRVYEVSGRPMPDGAIAFVVQDVSDGMVLARQIRSELKLHRAVLDRLDLALVVFDAQEMLMHASPAYRRIWPDSGETTFTESLSAWQQLCPDAAGWSRTGPGGEALCHPGRLPDGRVLAVTRMVLPGGANLFRFDEFTGPTLRQAGLDPLLSLHLADSPLADSPMAPAARAQVSPPASGSGLAEAPPGNAIPGAAALSAPAAGKVRGRPRRVSASRSARPEG